MNRPRFLSISSLVVSGVLLGACGPQEDPAAGPPLMRMTDERWASSTDLRITINQFGQPPMDLTGAKSDFKPSWSKTASSITFFRALAYGGGFHDWKTKLGVVNVDGSGFALLTNGDYADFNPTWTRDGSNQILFNRYAARGPTASDIYMISPQGSPGDEVRLSDPNEGFEWVFSGLMDGRLLVDRIGLFAPGVSSVRTFLLSPDPGRVGTYEEIVRPTDKMWHKLSLSPSETKVTYMLDNDNDMRTYDDVVLQYADFDLTSLEIASPVTITTDDRNCIAEYPRWNADETLIVYDSNCSGTYQMYAYRLADGVTGRISEERSSAFQFGNFEGCPK